MVIIKLNIGVTFLGKIGLSFGHRCFSVEISGRNEEIHGFQPKFVDFHVNFHFHAVFVDSDLKSAPNLQYLWSFGQNPQIL